jgi:hypothetical protein
VKCKENYVKLDKVIVIEFSSDALGYSMYQNVTKNNQSFDTQVLEKPEYMTQDNVLEKPEYTTQDNVPEKPEYMTQDNVPEKPE